MELIFRSASFILLAFCINKLWLGITGWRSHPVIPNNPFCDSVDFNKVFITHIHMSIKEKELILLLKNEVELALFHFINRDFIFDVMSFTMFSLITKSNSP